MMLTGAWWREYGAQGLEKEIAIYTFDEIYSWGATDLQARAGGREKL
jgi:hypothetical protein